MKRSTDYQIAQIMFLATLCPLISVFWLTGGAMIMENEEVLTVYKC